jgi:hypothetical protein
MHSCVSVVLRDLTGAFAIACSSRSSPAVGRVTSDSIRKRQIHFPSSPPAVISSSWPHRRAHSAAPRLRPHRLSAAWHLSSALFCAERPRRYGLDLVCPRHLLPAVCASLLGTRRRRRAVASCGLRAPSCVGVVCPVLYLHAPSCCIDELSASRGAPTGSCVTD